MAASSPTPFERGLALAEEVDADEVEARTTVLAPSAWTGKPSSSNAPGSAPRPRSRTRKPPANTTAPKPLRFTSSGASPSNGSGSGISGSAGPFGDELPDEIHQLRVPLVTPGDALAEVRREAGAAAVGAEEVPEHGDAQLAQRAVVKVVAAAGSRRLHVGEQPSSGSGNDSTVVEEPRLERPPRQVPATEPAGEPRSPPTGQGDITACQVQLLGDLAPRLAAADDQHRTRRQFRRVAVVLDVDLQQILRERGRSWPVGPLVGAGAEDHCPGDDLAGRRLEEETTFGPGPSEVASMPSRTGAPNPAVALEVRHDLVPWHEAVGVAAVVVMTGSWTNQFG